MFLKEVQFEKVFSSIRSIPSISFTLNKIGQKKNSSVRVSCEWVSYWLDGSNSESPPIQNFQCHLESQWMLVAWQQEMFAQSLQFHLRT
mmetsp:Transcript_20826/g.45161  ORF Transcript_20826/g.45161 Transcript_20826/m.45161 type:complete len:89 (+) Transcript_20826:137-403(+)